MRIDARTVLPLGITTIVSYGTTQYLFGVLVTPISRDMHWTGGRIPIAYSLCLLICGALGVLAGRHADAGRGRILMTAGSLLAATSLWLLSICRTLPQFYAIWGLGLGTASALTFYPVSFAIAGRRFKSAPASALLAITLFGGLAGPIFLPLQQSLITDLGWRHALDVIAAVQLLVAAPIHAFWVRYPTADGTTHAHAPLQKSRTFADSRFLLLTASAVMSAATGAFLTIAFVPFEIGRGWNAGVAAVIAGFFGLGSVPGRALGVALTKRFDCIAVLCATMLAQAAAIFVMAIAHGVCAVGGAAVLFGASYGLSPALRATAMIQVFGIGRFGAISGAQGVPLALASAFAPALGGVVSDRTGSYAGAFLLFSAASAAGCMLLLPLIETKVHGSQT